MELSKSLLIMIILLELKIIRLQNSQEPASLRIRCERMMLASEIPEIGIAHRCYIEKGITRVIPEIY